MIWFWYVLVEYGGVPISMLIHRTDINLLSGSSVWIFGKNNGNHSAGSLPKFSAFMHIHAMSQSQISNGLLCLRVLHHGMTPTFSFERWQGNPRWSWEASVTFWCAALKLRCLPLCPFAGAWHCRLPRAMDLMGKTTPGAMIPPMDPRLATWSHRLGHCRGHGGGAFGATRQGLTAVVPATVVATVVAATVVAAAVVVASTCVAGTAVGHDRPKCCNSQQFPACSSLWWFSIPESHIFQLGASAKSALWSTANLSAGLNSARLGQEAGASLENLTPFPSSPSRFTSKHTQKSWCVSSSTSTLVNIKIAGAVDLHPPNLTTKDLAILGLLHAHPRIYIIYIRSFYPSK